MLHCAIWFTVLCCAACPAAAKGVSDALKHLVQLKGNTPDSKEEQQHWTQLMELVEAAEKALDQDGQSTFRWC
jgi:hypothetical protein